jgi:hypothetical protein
MYYTHYSPVPGTQEAGQSQNTIATRQQEGPSPGIQATTYLSHEELAATSSQQFARSYPFPRGRKIPILQYSKSFATKSIYSYRNLLHPNCRNKRHQKVPVNIS